MATSRSEPSVCFGSSQRTWVTDLISHVSDHGGIRIVGTALTQDDAVAMEYDVLVIDDVSSVLSPRLVSRVQAEGRLVVGVYDTTRGAEIRERLMTTGIDALVGSDATATEIVRVVVDAVRRHSIDHELAMIVDEFAEPAATVPGEGEPAMVTSPARIVVVAGSDGATETAVALAGVVAGRGISVVLVDMDTLEPSVAQRLGLPLTPNIFTATEHLRLRSRLDDAFVRHPDGFAVIGGIPNPREWENITEIVAADLVGELATGFEMVIVKVNRHLEDLSTFAGSAGRFDVGRRIVAAATHVLAVTNASPLGGTRLLGMLGDVRLLGSAPVHVVVNHAPRSQYLQGEIAEEIQRSATVASLTFLPVDGRVRKASWQGETVRTGRFVKKVDGLADAVTDGIPTSRDPGAAAAPARGGASPLGDVAPVEHAEEPT